MYNSKNINQLPITKDNFKNLRLFFYVKKITNVILFIDK